MPSDDGTFDDTYFSRQDRFSVGTERPSGRFYLSIPVSNGVVDYEEYYELTEAQYEVFVTDRASAATFAEECRKHEHDALLLRKPGANRGTPV
ncbi:hypothetical protein LQ938_13890 [Microbacterium sp. cx-55]|uniref:hypothetical protein n=1 Tax=Microbacterium sp. cx-55 TaxID=2875948 RepID=UPI001CBF656B|nr:hypothetical protein [Microbacterium sp. cx-55]MBZ4488282.1 hypothetical protein [Microbacterium sp. cx-55]UGB34943.1 hypothetical protein LQ938_13890 [Microbacterium sp. cx-55]